MCGIAGIFATGPKTQIPDLRERLLAMTEAERHRGPDDEGVYLLPDASGGIANCRLAIRDLSPAGHMPMSNAEGTVWITYNGEIYNTDELRPELEFRGCLFRSQSDTEVILHGYQAWGERMVERLRGIFAFAIVDARGPNGATRLFLARDRLGVKPLYYARTDGALLFASELKAMRASNLVSHAISPTGLVGYLMLGSVPSPLTIMRDVRMLDAGCTLTLSPDDGAAEPARYWSLPTRTEEPPTTATAVEHVRFLLEDSVRTELVSDVPLGAFLSGGLDSSAVVALMRKATDGPIRTCSMVFDETEYSEASYSRAMAEAAGAEHYERTITAQDVADELDTMLWAMDQPTADGVNTYFAAQTAREAGLTVCLSGLGGDELFGGYPATFKGVPQLLRALALAQAVPRGPALVGRALDVLPRRRHWARVQDALERPLSPASAYLTRRGLFAPHEVQALVTSDVWDEASATFDPIRYIGERAEAPDGGSSFGAQPFSWTSRAELATYAHSQLLRDTDAMSMAHSLEVRVPFLDHRLVEVVLALPARLHAARSGPKPLLSTALDDALPPIIRRRRGKQGFIFPFGLWLQGPLRKKVGSLIGDVRQHPWLRAEAVNGVWQDYQTGRVHWSRLWSLAVLRSQNVIGP
jgi:asparagine synthase (glutamine-hydrolysing)